MPNRRIFPILCILITIAVSATAWDISSDYEVEWSKGLLVLRVTADTEPGDPPFPSARLTAEKAIERALPVLCRETASQIQVDSSKTIGDIMGSENSVLSAVRDLHYKVRRGESNFSDDLTQLTILFTLDLFPDLASPLISHDRPFKPERRLDWEPVGDFTGILIYAKGELPEYGKNTSAHLVPCLFPRIYDQEMVLLAAPYMVEPSAILTEGPVLYASSLDDAAVLRRVGYYPMRIVTRGVYGTRPTDPIIPLEWSDKIRSSESLQRLIAEGKVAVIF